MAIIKTDWRKLLNDKRLRGSDRIKDSRNEFESDFGRIIFSPAMRRMHDKTQVFPLTADDNIHSRLTHSMEVMAIGHSLGIKICENDAFSKKVGKTQTYLFREIPTILKNACLVHDIGNPPFGHFGESVIQNYFNDFFKCDKYNSLGLTDVEKEDFTLFDGNAQGFRVLTKLQMLNDVYGLNLTYATLSSFLKYPNCDSIDKSLTHKKKRGVFQTEREYLKNISEECGLIKNGKIIRHPLCYLMEAADSICYLVMDIEDGYNKKWYDFDFIVDKFNSIPKIKDEANKIKSKYEGTGENTTKMVKFRIFLIQYLVDLAVANFLKNIDIICDGEYEGELIKNDSYEVANELENFCLNFVFPNREITSLELTGHSVITGLLDIYTNFVFHKEKGYKNRAQGLISDSILRIAFLENHLPPNSNIDELNNYYKLRVIVDYISGMTDQFALTHYQKISGQRIN